MPNRNVRNCINFSDGFSSTIVPVYQLHGLCLLITRVIQAMGDALVGGCAKSKEGDQTLRFNNPYLLQPILDSVLAMKRFKVSQGLTCSVLVLVCVLAMSCENKAAKNDEQKASPAAVPIVSKNERPDLKVKLTDGTVASLKEVENKMIVVLFQPECDDCQREVTQIREHLDAFQGYKLFFISSHELSVIQKFAVDYKLSNVPNVAFGQTSVEAVIGNFGQIPAPSVYIYNEQSKMVKKFNGETEISSIISSL
jgi:peroxiredoxin